MDHNLLVSELHTLVVESKRRHPEVKEAGEHALEILKGVSPSADVIHEHADTLLAPVSLGCKTKVGKIIGLSIAALQRLVALKGVPTASLPGILTTLNSVSGQAVDIQLKILQTLLSILTYNPDVHDDILGNILLLCFKLQDSRVSVVSSTAAATLRQAVMIVFDRISSDTSTPSIPLALPSDPPMELTVTPSAIDAFNVFTDLCLLTAAGGSSSGFSLWTSGKEEKPRLLKLSSLQRTFGLELVESVLSGYEEGVKQRSELLFLLSHSLDPLLHKLLSEKPTFPIALRVCRLQFLLIRSFADQLPAQVEGCLTTLIRLGMGEHEDDAAKKENTAPWLRVLALEIFRGICGDGAQLRTIWSHFDRHGGSELFRKIVSALSRLLNEKPVLLGMGVQMNGIGVPSTDNLHSHAGYLDMGLGIMASAASAGITTVNSMMSSGTGGLGAHSGMKLRLIEQHDKAEAPIIPETYVYLLALQSLNAVAESIYVAAGQSLESLESTKGMAESAWPALLAALSYCIGTNLSDGLFAEVLSALQDFTVACGLLGLNTPRDAFLSILGKYAVPPPAVSAMQSYMDAPSSRNNSIHITDTLGLGSLGVGGPTGPPSLSERNLACLRSMVTTARILAQSLGDAWHDVLEVLQNANFMLAAKKPHTQHRRPPIASPQIPTAPAMARTASEPSEERPEVFEDLDVESIQNAINILFDGSKDLDDTAFTTFSNALCRLSSEMIGLDLQGLLSITDTNDLLPASPSLMLSSGGENRRRASGLHISTSMKSGERSFSLTKIRIVSTLNLNRLVSREPEVGWSVITQHLLSVSRHLTAPSTLRMQASETLSELLLGAVRVGKVSKPQHQVFDVLVRQVDVYPISNSVSTDYDVRSAGYQTLNQILESSGHSLEVGWKTIFGMLKNVCKEPVSSLKRSDSQLSISSTINRPSTLTKGDANLVRIAFPSLTLICTDFLSSLDPDSMRDCIVCLGCFGRQKEDVNITLAAIGLLWNVSDTVQGDSKELWLFLLSKLLELGQDSRLEVRSSAMQTLFRCVELYGSGLSVELWQDVFWKVISPLLDAAKGDESAILALTSIGNIINAFLPTLSSLPSFEKMYERVLERLALAFSNETTQCATASLKALGRALSSLDSNQSVDVKIKTFILDSTWSSFVRMSENLSRQQSYAQDTLLALVRVGSILHDQGTWNEDSIKQLSTILRSIMTYDKSPEYRPDVDHMSPVQDAIVQLVSSSSTLTLSVILSDLAEFASLAYLNSGEAGTVTFVALSKFSMNKVADLFEVHNRKVVDIYENETVERVLGAYAIPIKLKCDCPAPSKYGDDPPLWKTAMSMVVNVIDEVMATLDSKSISKARCDGIWAQIIDIFGGLLLADSSGAAQVDEDETFLLPILQRIRSAISPRLSRNVPDHLVWQFAEVLRKASVLYQFDVKRIGGTTAPAIPESAERVRYWAFDLLVSTVSRADSKEVKHVESDGDGDGNEGKRSVAKMVMPALLKRMEGSLKQFAEDSKNRGQMPFGRVREEELLYILRHLAMMQVWENSLPSLSTSALISSVICSSTRAHLFHFYPLLLDISFLRGHLPSMWMFPSEHAQLFGISLSDSVDSPAMLHDDDGIDGDKSEVDAGDGADLMEVGAKDVVRRCLELLGQEMGLAGELERKE